MTERGHTAVRACPECGGELAGNMPADFCPRCLLKAGLAAAHAPGPGGTARLPLPAAGSRGLPRPGERLGHYAIIRPLGEGGMGTVFEAEDLESGRRVALKLLSHTLDSPEARERFFREGRLAASINHPNSVYVFGTEEIGGVPVIAMELVVGGTLQDCVQSQGPLPPGEAVDAILQVIDGLDAAHHLGILHRDIKPSNCYRAEDGSVKVGDFGLSISTTIRIEPALTATGMFLGTPGFCSPEQLRGDEINVRSDIYAVGATLFYLLTGRTPFEAKGTVQLLATVLEQRAPSPRKFRPSIPPGLARIVLRCLEKQPGDRYKSYSELRQALASYSSIAPTPATLGLRFLAGALDLAFLNFVGTGVSWLAFHGPVDWMSFGEHSLKTVGLGLVSLCGVMLYYGLLEGRWGASPGKALCRLRVVGPDRNPPGFTRAATRALIYALTPALPFWTVYGAYALADSRLPISVQNVLGFTYLLVTALIFATARRHNGFAAFQDMLTKTRVVGRVALPLRPALEGEAAAPAVPANSPVFGPYHVLETLDQSASATWLLGYDLRLLRKVWLRVVPPGTPPLPASLRNIGRVGRLRWLASRRSPGENWDAFEAVSGKPLLPVVQERRPWTQVRFWLHDLAVELSAAQKDGTLPVLGLDRVWITSDGRAKLLDFRAPGGNGGSEPECGAPSESGDADGSTAEPPLIDGSRGFGIFLKQVATVALEGREAGAQPSDAISIPLALHVREFLKGLPAFPDAGAIVAELKALLHRVPVITRWRRAAMAAGCIAFPLFAAVGMVLGMFIMQQWSRRNPELMRLISLLQARPGAHPWTKHNDQLTERQVAIYIAAHYSGFITNQTSWNSLTAQSVIKGRDRQFAEESVALAPAPTPEEITQAEAAVGPLLDKTDVFSLASQPSLPFLVFAILMALGVAVPSIMAALLFRGGLVSRVAGVAFVRRDGALASRWRLLWRALLAWSPFLWGPILSVILLPAHAKLATVTACGFLAILTVLSISLPIRGLPDRLAGTWPVPR